MEKKSKNILSIKNISKSFNNVVALDNVSFSLKEGDVVCLIGPSGSGKTTLLRCLTGLEEVEKGCIEYFNEYKINPDYNNIKEIRKNISFVFQDFQLWPNKTVLENIILAPIIVKKFSQKEAIDIAEALLEKFELINKRDCHPDFLSGGQRQRVAIVRALAVKPKILFLDEITSALDPELIREVLNIIKILAKEGQTMIVVTHDLKFASEIADKIIFLDKGRVLQEASTSEFMYSQDNNRIRDFIKSISSNEQEINIFEGYNEFQSYHLGLVRRLKEGSTINVGAAVGDRWYECMGSSYNQWLQTRIRKKITLKMLLYQESSFNKQERATCPELTKYRQLPQSGTEDPVNYNVNEDIVAIQIFGKVPSVIEIKNADLAKSYLRFFESLWKISEDV